MPIIASFVGVAGRRNALDLESPLYAVEGHPVGHAPEDAMDHQHLRLVDFVAVARLVMPEAVVGLPILVQLALTGLAETAASAPLRNLCPFVLGKLVEDAVSELALWALATAIVHGTDLRSVLLELATQ